MRRPVAQALLALTAVAALAACSSPSSGSVPVAAPDLTGMTVSDARWAAIDSGLRVAGVEQGVDEQACTVTAQQPEAGTEVEVGSTMGLTLSCPQAEDMPAQPEQTPLPTQSAAATGAAAVQEAFAATYGWPDDPAWSAVESFSDRDYPRITVATSLVDEVADAEQAMGICNAVTSVLGEDWTGTYVTAGEGGPFLAECDRP